MNGLAEMIRVSQTVGMDDVTDYPELVSTIRYHCVRSFGSAVVHSGSEDARSNQPNVLKG